MCQFLVKNIIQSNNYSSVSRIVNINGTEQVVKKFYLSKMKNYEKQWAQQEIEILQKVDAEYCIKPEKIIQDKDSISLIFPYYSGGDLFDYLNRTKISKKKAYRIFLRIAKCLKYFHSLRYFHRDIKPENLVFKERNNIESIILIDFGFATDKKLATDYVGTLEFLAPEIIKGFPYDYRVDLWSLGITFCCILYKKLPFEDEKDSEVTKKLICENDNRKINNKIIKNLLMSNPSNRIGLDDVINALEHQLFLDNHYKKEDEHQSCSFEKLIESIPEICPTYQIREPLKI